MFVLGKKIGAKRGSENMKKRREGRLGWQRPGETAHPVIAEL